MISELKPYPESVEELLERCEALIDRYDLYELGEPKLHENCPDGTEGLSGEFRYGVSMIPCQWVTHVVRERTCTMECADRDWHDEGIPPEWTCSECGYVMHSPDRPNYCPGCGCKVVEK